MRKPEIGQRKSEIGYGQREADNGERVAGYALLVTESAPLIALRTVLA